MIPLLIGALAATWIALALCAWFIYHVLRQNGRILARLEALEPRRSFGERALAASRINRDGLRPGTVAPDFELPRLDGGRLSLRDYAGRRVLLVFSSPDCAPCQQLAPQLEAARRSVPDVEVVMISRGDPEANRRKTIESGATFPVALQRHWEISRAYGKFATPMAYLIDERGFIASAPVLGVNPILKLLAGEQSIAGLAS